MKSIKPFARVCTFLGMFIIALPEIGCFSSKIFHDEITALGVLHCQDREVSLAPSNDNEIRYWIDGEEHTPGCNWILKHVECRSEGCLYRCVETEALWLLSQSDTIVEMEKKVKGATLPQKYRFEVEK